MTISFYCGGGDVSGLGGGRGAVAVFASFTEDGTMCPAWLYLWQEKQDMVPLAGDVNLAPMRVGELGLIGNAPYFRHARQGSWHLTKSR